MARTENHADLMREYLNEQMNDLAGRIGGLQCVPTEHTIYEIANIMGKMLDVMGGILALQKEPAR